MKALTKIILLSKNKDECNEAAALKTMLGSFEFVVQIVVQKKIVERVNSVSKCLQSKQSNVENAAKLINNAIESLTLFRNNFDEAKDIAIKISEQWKVEAKFVSKRRIRIKKPFDELCQDERLNDPERFFKVNIFCGCLDIIVAQLSNRFKSLDATVKKFKAILPSTLVTATDDQLYEEAEQLIKYFRLYWVFLRAIARFQSMLNQTFLNDLQWKIWQSYSLLRTVFCHPVFLKYVPLLSYFCPSQ